MLLTQIYVRVDIIITCEKHLLDCIISLRGKVLVHRTSLTPPLFIEVMYICVRSINFITVSMIVLYDFGIVPTG